MAQVANVDVNTLLKDIKMDVTITGYREFRIRSIIGRYLIRLGMLIIGINGRVEFKE